MALLKIKKIQLIGITQNKEKVLEVLQNTGTLDITEIKTEDKSAKNNYKHFEEQEKLDLNYANLEFTINLLSKCTKPKGMFAPPIEVTLEEAKRTAKDFEYEEIAKKCSSIEDSLVKAKNAITSLNNELFNYKPWKSLSINLADLENTTTSKVMLGNVKTTVVNSLIEKAHKLSALISTEIVNQDTVESYIMIIFDNDLEKEVRQVLSEHKFTEADLPASNLLMDDYLKELEEKVADNQKEIEKLNGELLELSKNLDNLKVVYDYLGWQKEKFEQSKKIEETDYSFAMNGWIPEGNIEKLKEDIREVTKEFEIAELQLEENEIPPVKIKNNSFLSPFEAVSNIYGLPKYNELDPTPYLAIFFIIFFALCLTDAGYGVVMFIATALALKFIRMDSGTRKLVKLLMYGGIVTVIIGGLFGGWFSFTPDQVPSFLTYTAESGEKMFLFQKINALTNPIAALIIAIALGFIQVLTGVIIKFIHDFKNNGRKEALMDSFPWILMLSGIGFYILTMAGVLPTSLGVIGKWWVIVTAGILVLTQGRDKKSIIGKALSGVLSLYNLVGYMSDVLSYSRLLALGLATSIIGLAVNTIVGLVGGIPYVGWIFVIVIFVGGHLFNLAINALGSFIHAGRLQFVEFFTKFMEGGGDEFKPFSKKSKYIYIKNSIN